MAKTAGVFNGVGNGYHYVLAYAPYEGTSQIVGVMRFQSGPLNFIEGTVQGDTIRFTRLLGDGAHQTYEGHARGNSWEGEFTQSNMGGVYSWSAGLAGFPQ
jgi:hypothetical protein